MKKRKGAAFVLIIGIMVMVTAFMGILSIYFMTNTAQATKQRERMQAYYFAAAGLEIGVSALMEPAVNASGEQYYPYLEHYAANPAPKTEIIDLGDGNEIKITICTVDSGGNPWITGTSTGDVWILVSAAGNYTNDSGSTTQIGRLRLNSENPSSIIRELDTP